VYLLQLLDCESKLECAKLKILHKGFDSSAETFLVPNANTVNGNLVRCVFIVYSSAVAVFARNKNT